MIVLALAALFLLVVLVVAAYLASLLATCPTITDTCPTVLPVLHIKGVVK